MRTYILTKLGDRAASSIRAGDSGATKILCHLRSVGKASSDELKGLGASSYDIAKLTRHPAMIEEI